MQLRWEKDALLDLSDLRAYIAEDNPTAAQKIGRLILETISLLLNQPMLGKPGRVHNTREIVITGTPYTVTYHASADMITILRVFHQARKWPHDV